MTRLMRSIRHFPPLLFVLALLVSCDDDPVAGPDSDGSQLGIVVGRIDPGLVPTATGAAKDAGSAGPTVTAEELLGDGSLEPRATAGVNEDFTYRIGDIPIGSDGLVITAASEGADIGRVIVHGPVEGAVSVTAAPMNDETTVEAQVLIELVGTGLPPEALNTVELSLLVELDPGVARDVTVSAPDIGAIAEGLAANDAILDGVLDLDGATRFDATQQAAAEFALALDQGTAPDAAHDALADAFVAALGEAGASADGLAMATAGGATGLLRAMENANAEPRLDVAKAAVTLNLDTRLDILNSLPISMDGAAQSATAELEQTRSAVEAATSLAEIETALAGISEDPVQELLDLILSQLGNVPPQVQAQIETRLMEAFDQADLAAHLENAATPEEILAAIAAFREELQMAVDALLSTVMQSGGDLDPQDVEGLVQMFMALKGGPDIPVP